MSIARKLQWLCVLGLAACAADPSSGGGAPRAAAAPAAASVAGTRWVGIVDAGADHRTLPRLEFVREGRLAGYTGCNMLSGAWKMEDGAVRVGALATTKRMCVGPEGEYERRMLAAMGEGARGVREGDRLVFTGPGGARFEFREAAAT